MSRISRIIVTVTEYRMWKLVVVVVMITMGWLISYKTAPAVVDVLLLALGALGAVDIYARWMKRSIRKK